MPETTVDIPVTVRLTRDSDVWRATLGPFSSVAVDAWDAISLTVAKAREAAWDIAGVHQPKAIAVPEQPPVEPAPIAPTPTAGPDPL